MLSEEEEQEQLRLLREINARLIAQAKEYRRTCSVSGASKVTGWSGSYIRKLAKLGRIASVYVDGSWLIYVDSLIAYRDRPREEDNTVRVIAKRGDHILE